MPKVISKRIKEAVVEAVSEGVSVGFITKIKKDFNIIVDVNKGGRPKKLTPETQRTIRRLIMTEAADNAVEVNNIIKEALQIDVSDDTVRRCLKECGMKAKTKVKKPLLSDRHKKMRLKFAKEHLHWSVEQWKLVTWSDETKINRIGSDGRTWSWYDPKLGITSRNIQQTLKFGGGSLMMWGCFQGNKLGVLRRIEGKMTAVGYIDVLEGAYLRSLQKLGCEPRDTILMQDNDPKHNARITTNWLREKGIQVMEWPSQSPDLNPIENLWCVLKKRILLNKTQPNNLDELWDLVNKEWNNIDPQILNNLIASMPRRMQLVVKAKGGHIRY